LGLARAVAIRHLVERVVVVVQEVPARDVVDVAVGVAIGAVAEGADHVLRIEQPVPVGILHAGVCGVVGDVEHAVIVQVVGIGVQEGAAGGRFGLGVAGGV